MSKGVAYFRSLAGFYAVFGLITTFYPRLMQLFMTDEGVDATTRFSDQVWLHGGLDILSITLLLFVFSLLRPWSRSCRRQRFCTPSRRHRSGARCSWCRVLLLSPSRYSASCSPAPSTSNVLEPLQSR